MLYYFLLVSKIRSKTLAHEIEGTSCFYYGQEPWHGIGKKIGNPYINSSEAMNEAGLNWNVEKRALFTFSTNNNSTGERDLVQVHNSFAVVRTSDDSPLGIVGNIYEPKQNSDVFDFFNQFIEARVASWESAGSLRGGSRIWALAKIGENIVVKEGDEVIKYLLLANSHDGILNLTVGYTPIRVVCANTLAVAREDSKSKLLRFRHTKDIHQNLKDVKEMIDLVNRDFVASGEQYKRLASKGLNSYDLASYIRVVFDTGEKKEGKVVTQEERIVKKVTSLFDSSGDSSVWGAYNAITNYLSHSGGRTKDATMNSLWFGRNHAANQRALTQAIKLAAQEVLC